MYLPQERSQSFLGAAHCRKDFSYISGYGRWNRKMNICMSSWDLLKILASAGNPKRSPLTIICVPPLEWTLLFWKIDWEPELKIIRAICCRHQGRRWVVDRNFKGNTYLPGERAFKTHSYQSFRWRWWIMWCLWIIAGVTSNDELAFAYDNSFLFPWEIRHAESDSPF